LRNNVHRVHFNHPPPTGADSDTQTTHRGRNSRVSETQGLYRLREAPEGPDQAGRRAPHTPAPIPGGSRGTGSSRQEGSPHRLSAPNSPLDSQTSHQHRLQGPEPLASTHAPELQRPLPLPKFDGLRTEYIYIYIYCSVLAQVSGCVCVWSPCLL
jgi:hypothetical protein